MIKILIVKYLTDFIVYIFIYCRFYNSKQQLTLFMFTCVTSGIQRLCYHVDFDKFYAVTVLTGQLVTGYLAISYYSLLYPTQPVTVTITHNELKPQSVV